MGTVPLLHRLTQAVSTTGKNAQDAMVGQVAPRVGAGCSHCLYHGALAFVEVAALQVFRDDKTGQKWPPMHRSRFRCRTPTKNRSGKDGLNKMAKSSKLVATKRGQTAVKVVVSQ